MEQLTWIQSIGYVAAAMEIVMGAPQAYRTFKQRNDLQALFGVSLPSTALMFFHTIIWCVYGSRSLNVK